MGVNFFTDQAATQETAVSMNQGLVSDLQALAKDQKKTGASEKDKAASQAKDKSDTSKLLERGANATSKELLTELAGKLAASNIDLSAQNFVKKAGNKIKDEYDLMFQTKEGAEDSSDITDPRYMIHKQGENGGKSNQQGKGGEEGNLQNDAGKGELVREFTGTFAQFLVTGGTDLKKKLEQLERQLENNGLSHEDVLGLKTNISKSIRAEIASQIRETILKKYLSPKKSIENLLADKTYNKIVNFTYENEKIGGKNFGDHRGSLKEIVADEASQVKSEMKEFIAEEIENKLIQLHLNKGDGRKEIKELLEIGYKVGFNVDQFLKNFDQKKIDIGMTPFNPPANHGGGNEGSADQKKREQTGYEYSNDDEKELLINQLRAIYMRRALRGDMMTMMDTSFKIRKLKNGLIKLGVQFEDFKNVEKEGRAVARLKVMDMLKESMNEKATLYELSGPAYSLIEKKIKGALKNLERLGVELSSIEFKNLTDNANRCMYDTAVEELKAVTALLEHGRNPGLDKKQKLLVKLVMRLREESGIDEMLDEKIMDLFSREKSKTKTVKENA